MDPTWEFQAPQFVDFNHLEEREEEDLRADEFFNVDHENGELWTTAVEEEEEEGRLPPPRRGKAQGQSSQLTEPRPMNGTFSVGTSSTSQLTFVNVPLVPKINKPSNLVISWSKEGKTQKANQKPQQPVKKRRRLSNAIVKTLLASSGNNNQHQKMTPRRKVPKSIFGYKAGMTPKRLKTNLAEPRLSQNIGQPSKKIPTGATVPKPFKLSTEVRAEERKVLEEKKKKENDLHEELKKREKEQEEKEQAAQIANYRKTLIHKPQPIKTFKRVEIKRSDKELTLPESPKFVPKRRKMP